MEECPMLNARKLYPEFVGLVFLSLAGCVAVVGNTTTAKVSDVTSLPAVSEGRVLVNANSTAWGPGPASLPPGAQAAILEGNPAATGMFTLRLKFPANYKLPPHYHTGWEHVTVISGLLHLGMGEAFDMANAPALTAGSFSMMPPGMRHFAHAATETVSQLHGLGPWRVIYVNASDDPRNR
jgi:hypothetical protein